MEPNMYVQYTVHDKVRTVKSIFLYRESNAWGRLVIEKGVVSWDKYFIEVFNINFLYERRQFKIFVMTN
jgi:hypothetical protein